MSSEQAARYFWLLAAAHVVVWTLARLLAEPNAPLDVVEMAYLGHEWQLGYANHPPLAAWITEAAVVIGGGSIWAVYGFRFSLTKDPQVQFDIDALVLDAMRGLNDGLGLAGRRNVRTRRTRAR